MADDIAQRITALPLLDTPVPEDVLPVVDDPNNPGKKTKKTGFGKFLRTYNISAAEIAEGLSNDDLDFKQDQGDVIRYGENTNPGTTPMADAIQKAVNTNRKVILPLDQYFIGTTTITISKTTSFIGDVSSSADITSTSELIYTGTGASLLIDPGASSKIFKVFLDNFSIKASGAAITSATAIGLKGISSNNGRFQNIAVQGFKSGTGIQMTARTGQIGGLNKFVDMFLFNNKTGYEFTGVSAGNGDFGSVIDGGSVIGEGVVVDDSVGVKVGQFAAETVIAFTDVESFDFCYDLFGNGTTNGGGVKLICTRTEFQKTFAVRINSGTDRTQLILHRFAGGAVSTHLSDLGTLTFRTDPDANVRLNAASLELLNNIPLNMQEIGGIARSVVKMAPNDTVQFGSTVNPNFALADWNFNGAITLPQEVVITTNVITAAENGKTFYLDLVGGFTSTLPAPAIGLKYKFIVKTAPTTAYIITTNAGANILFGTFLDIIGELTSFSAQDTLNFVASASVVGDFLEVESDGTNWYCTAKSGADGGITVSVT